jgi:hypothetical protein
MKFLVYIGHPAQYLFFKNIIRELRINGHQITIIIKSKDVLETLLKTDDEKYINILPEGRKSGSWGILSGLIKRDFRLFNFLKNKKYNLLIGTDPSVAHMGLLRRTPVITVVEDDFEVIKRLAWITYPFTSQILTPTGCRTGKFEYKTIHYDGYMKLAYLHPNQFKRKPAKLKQPYFLIRISNLDAYHDRGIFGFSTDLLHKIVVLLRDKGQILISSESSLDTLLLPYELKIIPNEMQDVLANATILISDSQSMSVEAAMLGVPSIRFSDFTGKISVLEELEHIYKLTFGIPTSSPEKLFEKIFELLSISGLEEEFAKRREIMLKDKIDVTAFVVWFLDKYPESVNMMYEQPSLQNRFKS